MKAPDEALVGTWTTEDEDSNAEFSFVIEKGTFQVSGVDLSDGENFQVEEIVWDGEALSFTAVMLSTGFVSRNVFRAQPDGKAELELTLYEIWKKR